MAQGDFILVEKLWRKDRFCSFTFLPDINQLLIDVGTMDPTSKKLITSTHCYVDPSEFLAVLAADINSSLERFFPDDNRSRVGWPNYGFISYGGSGSVARVFKYHYWNTFTNPNDPSTRTLDQSARMIRCGHFEGKKTSTGAILPDMTKPIKAPDTIKLSMPEIVVLETKLRLVLGAHVGTLFPVQNRESQHSSTTPPADPSTVEDSY